MNDVSKRLSTLFEQHKLVFWYDEAGKLKDEFDALTLDVHKRHIDNNEFGIKYDVLTAGKDDKFQFNYISTLWQSHHQDRVTTNKDRYL